VASSSRSLGSSPGAGLLLRREGHEHHPGLRVGLQVEERGGQLRAGHPVEQAVVVLHEQAGLLAGDALKPPQLPERAAAVELGAEQRAGELGDLPGTAGGGDADAAHVPADVEVRVVHPDRPVEPHRHGLELPAELGGVGDALLDQLHEPLEGHLALDDAEPAHVLVPRRGLHGEEEGVGAAEALHAVAPRWCRLDRKGHCL
jgi:hypothetical protein